MKATIAQAVQALHSGKYIVHFRPEKDLTESDQYAIIRVSDEVYDVEEDE